MPSLPSLPPIFSIFPLLSSACPGVSPPNFARAARDAFPHNTTTTIVPFPFPESQAPILEDVLFQIQSVPDDVLDRGKPAVVQWTVESTDLFVKRDLEKRQAWVAVVKCALEIAKVIAENGFPLAKLRRVKELIKALGGANAVAKMLLKAKTLREFFIIGGVELAELGQMLLGLQGVVGACFSWV